jgi:hypothetical protein
MAMHGSGASWREAVIEGRADPGAGDSVEGAGQPQGWLGISSHALLDV